MSETFQITLDDERARLARERAGECGYTSVNEYLTSLVANEVAELELTPEMEAKLIEAMASPAVPMDEAWIEARCAKLREAMGQQAI